MKIVCCGVIKRVLGICIFSGFAAGVLGDGDALYKQGAAIYKSDPVKAFSFFIRGAEEGNVSAMVGAAVCLENGTGTDVDYAGALEWYERAAKQKSLKACEGLARIYASCPDPEFHDGEKAVKFASAYARNKARDADALALLAAAYARNFEFEKAVKASRKANSVSANEEFKRRTEGYCMGCPYPEGSTDSWMETAASSGSAWALRRYAQQHHNEGRFSESRTLYEKMGKDRGAEDNVALAGYMIRGVGGKKDVDTAIDLLTEGGKQGSVEAYQELGDIYFFGKNGRRKVGMALRYYERIPETERDAVTGYICKTYKNAVMHKSYESKSPDELYTLSGQRFHGGRYADESGGVSRSVSVPPHPVAALVFALAAAEQGHIFSMIRVEQMYFAGETGGGKCLKGTEVQPDHKKAAEWLERIKASGSDRIPTRNYDL